MVGGHDELLEGLIERLAPTDANDFLRSRENFKPMESICEAIGQEKENLHKISLDMQDVFQDAELMLSAFEGKNGTIGFLNSTYNDVSRLVKAPINDYFAASRVYKNCVKARIDAREGRPVSRTQLKALASLESVSFNLLNIFAFLQNESCAVFDKIYKSIAKYNRYLKSKFVKEEGRQTKNPFVNLLMEEEEIEEPTTYVKVRLIDANPVLTDTLLYVADTLPQYRKRVVRDGKKKKAVKELLSYDVNDAAERLTVLSDPKVLSYLREPQKFFEKLGHIFERLYTFSKKLEPDYRKIIDEGAVKLISDDPAFIEKVFFKGKGKLDKGIRRLKEARIDPINQREDDVLPENKKEKDHFKTRDKLLNLIYKAMENISKQQSEQEKEKIARETIVQSVALRAEINELLESAACRKLRKDKQGDNEHYVGRQRHPGRFYFERAPAPHIKMEEVIGKSFDTAKQHIAQIIETAQYPHIMTLSAPGRKVKSNLMMCGPYGCGKTELMRAVCADERVIGASVSVASTLTAYMHESVNNIKRIWDAAKELHQSAREQKPVGLCLDEFSAWFPEGGHGWADTDMQQIEEVMLEVLDGMEDYNGIITIASTNKPWMIPKGILRRFRYIDVVGQLTEEESKKILKMYLEKSMPVQDVEQHYQRWVKKLEDAPGDVLRKVADEAHFSLVPQYLRDHPKEASFIEKVLQKREAKKGDNDDKDVQYLKEKLAKYRKLTPEDVDRSVDYLLKQPPIRMQIATAKEFYIKTQEVLDELAEGEGRSGFGRLKRGSNLFEKER